MGQWGLDQNDSMEKALKENALIDKGKSEESTVLVPNNRVIELGDKHIQISQVDENQGSSFNPAGINFLGDSTESNYLKSLAKMNESADSEAIVEGD